MDETIREAASTLYNLLNHENRDTWKRPEMLDICRLAIEYLTLDGLEDARRGSDIEYALIDGDTQERRQAA